MSINRKPRTEQRWQDIIKASQESGQSIRSYCLRRGISEGVFHYWRKKLPHQAEPKLNQFITPTFVPVRFALGRNPCSSLIANQSGKSLAILSSLTATCQQFGINP
ncbi:MAG: hypothetical protein WCJ06_19060 [Planctomycetota bacterium]